MPPTGLLPLPDPTWSSRAKSLLNSTTSKGSARRGSRERERGQTWWTLQKETPWSHYKIGAVVLDPGKHQVLMRRHVLRR